MHSVSEHTRSLWQNLKSNTIFLACSGGVDSMVLLHMLNALKVNLTVIHVNYQLRGEESNSDAELVRSVCDKLNIPFDIRIVDLKKKLKKGGNLQDEARKVRYSWFNEILAENTSNRIALAHHQDDQVETFMMNLARKSGVIGLSCMKAEHKGIVRPLLDFSKAEILKYASNHQIEWREDQSNRSNNYTRNRLRNEFIPYLKSEIEGFDSSVLSLIGTFQQTQHELEHIVRPMVRSILVNHSLQISDFESLNAYEQIELLRQLNIPASYAPRLSDLGERGKKLKFNDSEFEAIVRDENHFTFLKEDGRSFDLCTEKVDALPITFNKSEVYFDASKIQGTLQLRKWEIGDRISPVGMKGSQLISDIIKDAKITAEQKLNQLVVHDNEAILWCVGLKVGRNAIANIHTESILRCSIISLEAEESEAQ